MDILSPSPVLITHHPPFPETTTTMDNGMFHSIPIPSTDENDKLDSSYINNVDLLKLEKRTVNALEGNRSRIHSCIFTHNAFVLVWNLLELSPWSRIKGQVICLAIEVGELEIGTWKGRDWNKEGEVTTVGNRNSVLLGIWEAV